MEKDNWTLYIDPDTRDLVLDDDGNIVTIAGHETTAQAVRLTLSVWKGEWPLDLDHGTDYERIMGKKPIELEEDEREEVLREAIFQEGAVVEIEELNITTKEKRGIAVEFIGTLDDGAKISTEVIAG